ncbi:hypothetical protein SNE40_001539 [Patella caerulea]|uniref:Metalloendopeptidase n=1 Tax=Patella caerulea TaxID=87958 RepID=A0AAN8Q891_PATCE
MVLKTQLCVICMQVLLYTSFILSLPPMNANRPPPLRHKLGDEKETNLTIDQIITQTLGGVDVAAQKMRSPGDNILAELDMMLTYEQFINLYEPPSSDIVVSNASSVRRKKRKAVRSTRLRWSDKAVPYKFAARHFDSKEQYMMKQAMTEWERYTCLRFRKATKADKNVLQFQNGEGCNSQLGMVGGIQVLNLEAPGCRYRGLYLHEVGHAIGLVHEHQLPTRDDYIKILYQNVAPQMKVWFNKYSPVEVNQNEVPYEYSSVMHYGITAFSKDGKSKTIEAKFQSREEEIGRVYLKELSFTDVKAVNLMYKCGDFCPKTIVCRNGGYVDQNCRCICPDGTSDCQDTETKPIDKEGSCVNLYDDWPCNVWANYGECERNHDYMKRNCRKACRVCGKSHTEYEENHFTTWAWQWFGMFADLFPQDWKIGVCQDFYPSDKCSGWRNNGDCVTNKNWMTRNCKKTCNYCITQDNVIKPEVNCNNTHPNEDECNKWALEAECHINHKWMAKNCRKACRMCATDIEPTEDSSETGGGEDGDCVDQHDTSQCKGWARAGECTVNAIWMVPNCRKSCGKCNDGDCKNLYDSTQCKIWAEEGECNKNPVWMEDNCAMACKACTPDGDTSKPDVTTTATVTSDDKQNNGTCKNDHNDVECKIWAESGHCDINPEWMKSHCKKSCKVCNGGDSDDKLKPSVDCFDKNQECAGWAKFGYCETNPRYNLIYCKYSCKNCNGCRDEQLLCAVWAKGGACIQNAAYMLRHCQKSCKVCTH